MFFYIGTLFPCKPYSDGVFLFDFCFTAIQHVLGHFGRGQLPELHCSWASLLGSLPVLSAHSFASNWQLLFLRENGFRIIFMTKSPRKNVSNVGIELGAVCMPSGHASDRATALDLQRGCNKRKRRHGRENINMFLIHSTYIPHNLYSYIHSISLYIHVEKNLVFVYWCCLFINITFRCHLYWFIFPVCWICN